MTKRRREKRKGTEKRRPPWGRRLAEQLFKTITGQVVLAVTALTVIIGGWVSLDGYVAKAADLRLTDARLDEWKTSDDLAKIQQRLWRYQDRYGKDCERAEQVVREECRTLREQWKRHEEKLRQYELKK